MCCVEGNAFPISVHLLFFSVLHHCLFFEYTYLTDLLLADIFICFHNTCFQCLHVELVVDVSELQEAGSSDSGEGGKHVSPGTQGH